IGFLSAAVWQIGGTALEEYGTSKRRQRKLKPGRSDLWIRLDKTFCHECEAKWIWLKLGAKPEPPAEKVYAGLSQAVADLHKLRAKKGLALCFVTVAVPASNALECRNLRNAWLRALECDTRYGAIVWIG